MQRTRPKKGSKHGHRPDRALNLLDICLTRCWVSEMCHVHPVKVQQGGGGSNDGSSASGTQRALVTSEDAACCCWLVASLGKCFPVSDSKVSTWFCEVKAAVSQPLPQADLWPWAPYVLSLWERKGTKEQEGAWGLWFWFLGGSHKLVGHDHGTQLHHSLVCFCAIFYIKK